MGELGRDWLSGVGVTGVARVGGTTKLGRYVGHWSVQKLYVLGCTSAAWFYYLPSAGCVYYPALLSRTQGPRWAMHDTGSVEFTQQ
jgi:hypothetical protein